MALLKRKRTRQPPRNRKRRRMNMPVTRSLRPYGAKTYAFKRTLECLPWYYTAGAWTQNLTNVITTSSTVNLHTGILKFRLADLPQYGEFTALFEKFRITGVKLRFVPYYGTQSSGQGSSPLMMSLAIAVDKGANDLATANPTFTGLMEQQDVKIRTTQRPFSLYISYPTTHTVLDGQSQVAYANRWLDSEIAGSTLVDHHGVKFCFEGQVSDTVTCAFRIFATYYIKCRNPQ